MRAKSEKLKISGFRRVSGFRASDFGYLLRHGNHHLRRVLVERREPDPVPLLLLFVGGVLIQRLWVVVVYG